MPDLAGPGSIAIAHSLDNCVRGVAISAVSGKHRDVTISYCDINYRNTRGEFSLSALVWRTIWILRCTSSMLYVIKAPKLL